MRDVAVIGIGMTSFGELWETPLRSLWAEASLGMRQSPRGESETEPTFGPTWPNWEFSDAIVMSHIVAMTFPPPMA